MTTKLSPIKGRVVARFLINLTILLAPSGRPVHGVSRGSSVASSGTLVVNKVNTIIIRGRQKANNPLKYQTELNDKAHKDVVLVRGFSNSQ